LKRFGKRLTSQLGQQASDLRLPPLEALLIIVALGVTELRADLVEFFLEEPGHYIFLVLTEIDDHARPPVSGMPISGI
jgi:hypothetical protein